MNLIKLEENFDSITKKNIPINYNHFLKLAFKYTPFILTKTVAKNRFEKTVALCNLVCKKSGEIKAAFFLTNSKNVLPYLFIFYYNHDNKIKSLDFKTLKKKHISL